MKITKILIVLFPITKITQRTLNNVQTKIVITHYRKQTR